MTITEASPATTTRDVAELVERGALVRSGELRPFRFDRVIQRLNELDLTLLERSAGPPSDLVTTATQN